MAPSPGLRQVLERNKDSLYNIALPVSDADLPELLPAMKKCTGLRTFTCGSPQLTNKSAPAIAEVLRLLPEVDAIGLHSRMDDDGFVQLEAILCDMANRLKRLSLYWTRVSPALLSTTLSPLSNLTFLTLVGNPIGDDGFQQVAASLCHLRRLKHLHLCDIGVTWQSLPKLEEVLLSCSRMKRCSLSAGKKSFPLAGEDITKISSLTTLRLVQKMEWKESYYGYHLTDTLAFRNPCSQLLFLKFYV